MLDFPLPVMSHIIVIDPIESGKTQNISFAIETAFLTGLQADI
jgi:hypothetical protein